MAQFDDLAYELQENILSIDLVIQFLLVCQAWYHIVRPLIWLKLAIPTFRRGHCWYSDISKFWGIQYVHHLCFSQCRSHPFAINALALNSMTHLTLCNFRDLDPLVFLARLPHLRFLELVGPRRPSSKVGITHSSAPWNVPAFQVDSTTELPLDRLQALEQLVLRHLTIPALRIVCFWLTDSKTILICDWPSFEHCGPFMPIVFTSWYNRDYQHGAKWSPSTVDDVMDFSSKRWYELNIEEAYMILGDWIPSDIVDDDRYYNPPKEAMAHAFSIAELLLQIFSYCSSWDLVSLMPVSHLWYDTIASEIWTKIVVHASDRTDGAFSNEHMRSKLRYAKQINFWQCFQHPSTNLARLTFKAIELVELTLVVALSAAARPRVRQG
ncbi:hypothetical protein C8J56DRAFT_1054508 [Mycena floridula]|nr:hypothetical protein C8J56DRAFT_1054508 [Mycena floridula]